MLIKIKEKNIKYENVNKSNRKFKISVMKNIIILYIRNTFCFEMKNKIEKHTNNI